MLLAEAQRKDKETKERSRKVRKGRQEKQTAFQMVLWRVEKFQYDSTSYLFLSFFAAFADFARDFSFSFLCASASLREQSFLRGNS
jgi:hypothetical protein